MRIVVATIGSRGDVQPYVNLCQGLRDAGYDVILATNPSLCSLGRSHGVETLPVGPAIDIGLEAEKLLEGSFGNMYLGMIRVMKLGARLVEEAFPDVVKACEGADLIITSDTGSGSAEADKLSRPWLSVTLQPLRVPIDHLNPSFLSRIIWGSFGKLLLLPVNGMRKRLGAPLVSDIAKMQSSRMILLPVSRYVAPPDPRRSSHVRQTGYWFAKPLEGWAPPDGLEEFLKKGEPPIAVSLGVMGLSGRSARESARIVLEALRELGTRAVVQGWDESLRGLASSASIYFVDSIPFEWLFSRVAAVVHHGGFGTTASAFRAGVPAIAIPHLIDQFYWSKRICELGVGPMSIARGKLRVGNLRDAISQSLHDKGIRERAAELGGLIRAEPDGVSEAVSILGSFLRENRG